MKVNAHTHYNAILVIMCTIITIVQNPDYCVVLPLSHTPSIPVSMQQNASVRAFGVSRAANSMGIHPPPPNI